jgi:hypothetical protein
MHHEIGKINSALARVREARPGRRPRRFRNRSPPIP